jgi:hypothetical protein
MQPPRGPSNIWLNFSDDACWCRAAAVDIKYILRAVREIAAALTELSERAQRPKSTPDEISTECSMVRTLARVDLRSLFYAREIQRDPK